MAEAMTWRMAVMKSWGLDSFVVPVRVVAAKGAGVEPGKVIECPGWLKDRRVALAKMPPPTLPEVEMSFRAAEEYRMGKK
jgi:hypothetical protein